MSGLVECQCIFVEVRNDSVPHSGRVEYRAETCPVCRVLDVSVLAGSTAVAVFDTQSPKFQRMH
jgi:hypothetical protein